MKPRDKSSLFKYYFIILQIFIIQFSSQICNGENIHHNLPDNLEIIDPKTLGLSGTDLEKFLGNVKLLPLEGEFGGDGSPKTQILTVGFDGDEKINLQDFESLSTAGLPDSDKKIAEMAFKKFQNFFQNPKSAKDFDEAVKESTEKDYLHSSSFATSTPSVLTSSTTSRGFDREKPKHNKRVRIGKKPIFSSTFRSIPEDIYGNEFAVGTTIRYSQGDLQQNYQERPPTFRQQEFRNNQQFQQVRNHENFQRPLEQHQQIQNPQQHRNHELTNKPHKPKQISNNFHNQHQQQQHLPNRQQNFQIQNQGQDNSNQRYNNRLQHPYSHHLHPQSYENVPKYQHQQNYNQQNNFQQNPNNVQIQVQQTPNLHQNGFTNTRIRIQDQPVRNEMQETTSQHPQYSQYTESYTQHPNPPFTPPSFSLQTSAQTYLQNGGGGHRFAAQDPPKRIVLKHADQNALMASIQPPYQHQNYPHVPKQQHFTLRPQQNPRPFPAVKPHQTFPTDTTQHNFQTTSTQFNYEKHNRQHKQIHYPDRENEIVQPQKHHLTKFHQDQQKQNYELIQQQRNINQHSQNLNQQPNQQHFNPSQIDPLHYKHELNFASQSIQIPHRPPQYFQHPPPPPPQHHFTHPNLPPPPSTPISMSGIFQITPSTPLIMISTVENAMKAHQTNLERMREMEQTKHYEISQNQIPGTNTGFQQSKPHFQNSQPFPTQQFHSSIRQNYDIQPPPYFKQDPIPTAQTQQQFIHRPHPPPPPIVPPPPSFKGPNQPRLKYVRIPPNRLQQRFPPPHPPPYHPIPIIHAVHHNLNNRIPPPPPPPQQQGQQYHQHQQSQNFQPELQLDLMPPPII